MFATKRRFSLRTEVWHYHHQASIDILPVSRQTRFVARSGLSLLDSLSIAGTLPQPLFNFEPLHFPQRAQLFSVIEIIDIISCNEIRIFFSNNLVIPSKISFSNHGTHAQFEGVPQHRVLYCVERLSLDLMKE